MFNYSVAEDSLDGFEVCINVTGEIERSVIFVISTQDVTARSK